MSKPWYTFRFISPGSSSTEETGALNPSDLAARKSGDQKKQEPLIAVEHGYITNLQNAVDTNNLVFMIFLMFGFGALLPWNMFLVISHDYYTSFKLYDAVTNGTWHSSSFQNSMTVSAQIPNVLFSIASIFLSSRGDLTRRMKLCMLVVLLMVILTMTCVYIETSTWVTTFYLLTILTIIILNAACGLFQNSMFGLASPFPFKYTNAIIIGQNFCGIAVTVLSILTKMVSDDVQIRTLLFFGISSVAVILCFVLLGFIKKLAFYRRYGEIETGADVFDDSDENNIWENIIIAFSKSKAQFANIFLLFFVTLALFPNICMYVKDQKADEDYSFVLPQSYYMDVGTFLNFNLFAFLGSLTANWIRAFGPKTIWIPVVARFWFLFYFPAANYIPSGSTRLHPVLFESTWFFVFNVTALAFTSGYLSSLIMMYAPKAHGEPKIQRMAGMIAAFFLITGILFGLAFSWPIKFMVTGTI